MRFRLPFLIALMWLVFHSNTFAQAVKNHDGTPVTTKYCFQDKNFQLIGQPAGGTFTGCGISQQDGIWNFNPVTATAGTTVFPFQCMISYTVNGSTVNIPFLIWKPVILNPPLEDSFTCNGDFKLHASTLYAGDYQYNWSPANFLTTPDLSTSTGHIQESQTFLLTATDASSGCSVTGNVTIVKDDYPVISVSPDTTILNRMSVKLEATGANTYRWSPSKWLDNPNVAKPVATPDETTVYTVTGRSFYGCYSSADVTITVNNNIFIPTAFSPNGDGVNDVFKIVNFGFDEILEYRIFDRWGKEVFNAMNGMAEWDGTYKGKVLEVGTYYYVIKISYKNSVAKIQKGDITMIR